MVIKKLELLKIIWFYINEENDMKVCIISCFEWYEKRLKYVKNVFEKKGVDVIYITSDFDHIEKQYIEKKTDIRYIHTKQYFKNLSFKRILSHIDFAQKAYNEVKKVNPDYIYMLLPPNFLLKVVTKYCKTNVNTKLFLDIIDMWPESMPLKKENWLIRFLYKMWQRIRDKNIYKADIVFTECDLYQEYLRTLVSPNKLHTLYIVKDMIQELSFTWETNFQGIVFAYLGSINNILDIDKICNILSKLVKKKDVIVRIIGKGERKNQFIVRLESIGIQVIDEGIIYDERKKAQILSQCDFGLNMLKNEIYVGLTTKSVDYFSVGLPILNTIRGDSEKLVEKYNAGFNVNKMTEETLIHNLLKMQRKDVQEMHQNALCLFQENFTPTIFMEKLAGQLKGIGYKEESDELSGV